MKALNGQYLKEKCSLCNAYERKFLSNIFQDEALSSIGFHGHKTRKQLHVSITDYAQECNLLTYKESNVCTVYAFVVTLK